MKKLLIIAFFLAVASICHAQLGTPMAQYSGNQVIYNPGYSGIYDLLALNLSIRKTWVGLPGSPSLISANGHAPFKNQRNSLGFIFQREQWGPLFGNFCYANYAHKIYFKNSLLSLGVQAGFINSVTDWDMIDYVTHENDPGLGEGRTSNTSFDLNVGVYYQAAMFYLGLSAKHLTHPKFHSLRDSATGVEWYSQKRMNTFLTAGFHFKIDDDWALHPEALIRYVYTEPMSVTAGVHAVYQNRFFLGTSLHTGQRAVSFSARAFLTEQLRLAYSYDVYFGKLRSFQKGSHEILINYHIPLWDKKKTVTLLWL